MSPWNASAVNSSSVAMRDFRPKRPMRPVSPGRCPWNVRLGVGLRLILHAVNSPRDGTAALGLLRVRRVRSRRPRPPRGSRGRTPPGRCGRWTTDVGQERRSARWRRPPSAGAPSVRKGRREAASSGRHLGDRARDPCRRWRGRRRRPAGCRADPAPAPRGTAARTARRRRRTARICVVGEAGDRQIGGVVTDDDQVVGRSPSSPQPPAATATAKAMRHPSGARSVIENKSHYQYHSYR